MMVGAPPERLLSHPSDVETEPVLALPSLLRLGPQPLNRLV
ncbi:hypothetical protein DU475_07140 [Rhodopseudomonas sp. WA056]|nr:hypothetical protein [Rhodopseudomonas sp. WA056]